MRWHPSSPVARDFAAWRPGPSAAEVERQKAFTSGQQEPNSILDQLSDDDIAMLMETEEEVREESARH